MKDIPLLSPDRKQATDHRSGALRVDKDEFDSDKLLLKDFLSFFKVLPTQLNTPIEHLLKKVDESLTASGALSPTPKTHVSSFTSYYLTSSVASSKF